MKFNLFLCFCIISKMKVMTSPAVVPMWEQEVLQKHLVVVAEELGLLVTAAVLRSTLVPKDNAKGLHYNGLTRQNCVYRTVEEKR